MDMCFECAEFPCSNVEANKPMMERAEEYHRLGRSDWLRCQAEKARLGFEGHTGKCYQVCASELPPSS